MLPCERESTLRMRPAIEERRNESRRAVAGRAVPLVRLPKFAPMPILVAIAASCMRNATRKIPFLVALSAGKLRVLSVQSKAGKGTMIEFLPRATIPESACVVALLATAALFQELERSAMPVGVTAPAPLAEGDSFKEECPWTCTSLLRQIPARSSAGGGGNTPCVALFARDLLVHSG